MSTFFNADDLRSASASKGIGLSLEYPTDLYSRYRKTWFDWFFPVGSVLGLVGLLASFWQKVERMRHESNDSIELVSNP
jgi:hypothetical protein